MRTPRQFELSKHMPIVSKEGANTNLISPMPGRVVSIAVKDGEKVLVGEEICVIEAMKMRNILRAPQDCVVKSIKVAVGQDVTVDQLLVGKMKILGRFRFWFFFCLFFCCCVVFACSEFFFFFAEFDKPEKAK